MDATGAKAELVKELRRIGTRVEQAAANLEISVRVDPGLAEDQFILDTLEGQVWGGSEDAVWVGIAQLLALELAIEADLCVLWSAVGAATRRSGMYRQIA